MPEVYKKRIVKLLRHPDYAPVKVGELAKTLGVSTEDYPQFKEAFELLRQAGHIVIGSRSLVMLPPMTGRIIGTFRANPKGFGFVIPLEPNSHGDLFIAPRSTGNAMTGDIVAVKVLQRGKREEQRISGEVVEILERSNSKFVGTLVHEPEGWMVKPDGGTFLETIAVEDITAKNAEANDKVVVEMLTFPTERTIGRGVILEVLGKAGRYDTEISSIIHQFHIPTEFPQECLDQAKFAATSFAPEQTDSREDITDKIIVTIDPPDAKDFDDAISLESDDKGNMVLGIHIADVSTFIRENSPLDVEARVRGNSVYLPQKTIPMLPEVLSNGVCSLQPKQKRFTKSAFITYNNNGEIIAKRFANSIIESKQRLTYQQADKILKGHTKDIPVEVVELLKNMDKLARLIEHRRREAGMLHLDLPETDIVMDKSGRVVDAHPTDTSYPHTIIEMFMVEANDAVASLLDKHEIPFIRRVHPDPDTLTMQNLSKFVRSLGYTMSKTPDRYAIQGLLESVKDKDNSLAVNLVVLRSFEKAVYAPSRMGHYALASTHYCHFTSPIRRYADLVVHRAFELCIAGQVDKDLLPERESLIETCKHISFTEQRAEDAEQELKTVLILIMLKERIGDEIECVITGLANFGIFARSKKFGIEGFIEMTELGPDKWHYNNRTKCIVGENSGITVRLGEALSARIVSVNIPARKLSLVPSKALVEAKDLVRVKPKKGKKFTKSSRTRTKRRKGR